MKFEEKEMRAWRVIMCEAFSALDRKRNAKSKEQKLEAKSR